MIISFLIQMIFLNEEKHMHFNQELKEIALKHLKKNLQFTPKFANTGDEY